MSFGYSVGDFMLLTQLAYRIIQNARRACGAHDDLAREVSSLHIVLQRVQSEVSKPDSLLNNAEDNRRRELERLARHCERVLRVLEQILDKYNALSQEKRSVTKLWQKVRFGNGEMLDLGKIRTELATHTQALNMFLNLLSIGSQGKVEKYMDSHGEELREIKHSLHWVTASTQANSHEEKSILTTYGEDDKAIWKAFRRELIDEGFSCQILDKHRRTIKKYVLELGERGALDEPPPDPYRFEEGSEFSANSLLGSPNGLESSTPNDKAGKLTGVDAVDVDDDNFGNQKSETEEEECVGAIELPPDTTARPPNGQGEGYEGYEGVMPSTIPKQIATTGTDNRNSITQSSQPLGQTPMDESVPVTEYRNIPPLLDGKAGPKLASVEEIIDEDFVVGAHPNCDLPREASLAYDSANEGPKHVPRDPLPEPKLAREAYVQDESVDCSYPLPRSSENMSSRHEMTVDIGAQEKEQKSQDLKEARSGWESYNEADRDPNYVKASQRRVATNDATHNGPPRRAETFTAAYNVRHVPPSHLSNDSENESFDYYDSSTESSSSNVSIKPPVKEAHKQRHCRKGKFVSYGDEDEYSEDEEVTAECYTTEKLWKYLRERKTRRSIYWNAIAQPLHQPSRSSVKPVLKTWSKEFDFDTITWDGWNDCFGRGSIWNSLRKSEHKSSCFSAVNRLPDVPITFHSPDIQPPGSILKFSINHSVISSLE
ncbi:hypothetical protein LSUE1_G010039 [Lachnellula suecica]|uniref:Fungal N-terminal domain-containing protein n=1 Tax=Lachnellula suecica TaxID=602035 RepID=A0A8T9BTZ1_9HELO|nr:hypothetical protein LSUE1_G010039 [Lachnellula suecica]